MFGSKSQLGTINIDSIEINDSSVHLSTVCRNLAVTFDSCMTMSHHVSNVCKSVRFQLCNLGIIRKYLTHSATVYTTVEPDLAQCRA